MFRFPKGFGHQVIALTRQYGSSSTPRATCLYDFHVAQGGKMVDFAGYLMPVQYEGLGIAASHLHTRKHASIFDVSHMLQTCIRGKDRIKFMESLCVADVQGLKENHGTLSVFTNDQGGILDDLIVTKTNQDDLYLVTNAGCRETDVPLMESKVQDMQRQGLDVTLEYLENRGLIALQGPESARVLQSLCPQVTLSQIKFMTSCVTRVNGVDDVRITRCGYTGEDGFEISIQDSETAGLVEKLLSSEEGKVELAGLGARDSLRLEAGLCLYGNDIDAKTTPVEAGLTWTIGKRRREEKGFPGAEVILNQIKTKPKIKRVGLISSGPPARSHTAVIDPAQGTPVGEITSGCPSPSLEGHNVSMAYLPTTLSKIGTKVQLQIRKKTVSAEVVKMPFVPSNYYSS
ncbi:aminomethyltransferase, mitochondrial-like [Tigriopus californicus]|uniref:aminomethyltransferase, mitochondrial-like n=1 Tax=Tigriopus californicus TaxID=6832 RepID=UPI0027DA6327|nr:aminomethyltransferase, mitochondrial-like [Tigriopus californicus]